MDFPKHGGWLIGAGFLLGTVGVQALTSPAAKKCYVQGVAQGLRAKAAYESIVEQAKAEVDDIVAEASYITGQDEAGEEAGTEEAAAPAEGKPQPKATEKPAK